MKTALIVLAAFSALLLCAVVYLLATRKKIKAADSGNEKDGFGDFSEILTNTANAVWEYDYETGKAHITKLKHSNDSQSMLYKTDRFSLNDIKESLIADGTVSPVSAETFRKLSSDVISGVRQCSCVLQMLSRSGSYKWYSVYGMRLSDENGSPVRFIGQVVNIDNDHRGMADAQLSEPLLESPMLYTRHIVKDKINERLRASDGTSHALLLIDIDHFRQIKESVGAKFGDALILELGDMLGKTFPSDSVIGRVSYDEFVVFLSGTDDRKTTAEYANKCCGCLNHCFLNTDKSEHVSCSVGIAEAPESGSDYEQLFYRADMALCLAKLSGRNNYQFFSNETGACLDALTENKMAITEESRDLDFEEGLTLGTHKLLPQVIDTLFDTNDLSSSINIALSMIGIRMDFDYCGIMEFMGNNENYLDLTYCWLSENLSSCGEIPKTMQHEDVLTMCTLIHDGDPYIYCRDFSALDEAQRAAAKPYIDAGIRSFIQCPVRDGSMVVGIIGFGICRENMLLSSEQCDIVALASKIIGGYLRQLRTKQDIKTLDENDRLTGTMRVTRFFTEAEKIIAENPDTNFAIVFADVDGFKFINETYGYKVGDDILIHIADLISSVQSSNEILSRVDADKFVALFEYTSSENLRNKLYTCEMLISSIKKTDVDCYKLPMRVGIYLAKKGETNVSLMVDKANLARKQLKGIHSSAYMIFDDSMKTRIKKQKEIEEVMNEALAKEEFVVYLQPKFSLSREEMVGAEALIRWKRPGLGVVAPDEFIPIFEDNGFVIDLDFFVLEKVCRKLRSDLDNGLFVCPVSVNFSRVHLKTDNFTERLRDILEKYGIPANLIEIEITESALTDNEDYLAEIIQSLHDMGLAVAMDDFGSGYSSLNLLKKLPVDVLKIDKNFFSSNTATADRERSIIANVINMARDLNIRVVSEGVETSDQAEFLKGIHCDQAQGFLYARPMDMESYKRLYQCTAPCAAQ